MNYVINCYDGQYNHQSKIFTSQEEAECVAEMLREAFPNEWERVEIQNLSDYATINAKCMRIAELNHQLFILELDDYAYLHGKGAEIEAVRAEIAQLEAEVRAMQLHNWYNRKAEAGN